MTTRYLLDRLFPSLNPTDVEKIILQRIIFAIQKNQSVNIKNIAKECYTSPSTISRLVKKSHCNNYPELLYYLRENFQSQHSFKIEQFSFLSLSKDYEEVISTLQAWFITHQCYSYGEGFCRFINHYFIKKLLVMSKISVDLDAIELARIHASQQNPPILFIFSKSGETEGCLRRINDCHSLLGKVVSFVSSKNSNIYKQSDLSFCIEEKQRGDLENSSLNYFYGNTINVIEFFCNKVLNPIKNV